MPDRETIFAAVFFLLFWVAVYGGCSALTPHIPWRVDLALPGEAHIPLVRLSAIPYLSLGGLQILAPVVLGRWEAVRPLLYVLVLETLIAAVFFVLMPAYAHPWIDPAPDGYAMALADAVNLEHNFFPSLHVTYAVTSAQFVSRRAQRPLALLAWLWAASIAASTVLLRQHYLLDVAGGTLLALSAERWVSRWLERSLPSPPPARGGQA